MSDTIMRGLDLWARRVDSEEAKAVSRNLYEIYRSAQEIIRVVDHLVQGDHTATDDSKSLIELNAWIYEEMVDHIGVMKQPLDKVIDSL